ncbi:MAG: acyloxyacyl hydrolase [Rhodospirillaceae bacterium]|nr:acyloxyacyl hydrolase [Rhodospirillaceae bacterium]
MLRSFVVGVLGLALLLCAVSINAGSAKAADDFGQLLVGAGQYDIIPNDNKSGAVYAQYRFGWGFGEGWLGQNFMGIKPLVGGFLNTDSGHFAFVGFAAPFSWGKNDMWQFEPSAGIGLYHQGDSTFLGGKEQFHVGFQGSVRVITGVRAGMGLTHVSNATLLHKKNRGTNILMGTVGLEF